MKYVIILIIVIAEILFGCLFPDSWNFVFWVIGITMFTPLLWSLSLLIADTIHNYFDK